MDECFISRCKCFSGVLMSFQSKCATTTLNQRVQGSSPCAPTKIPSSIGIIIAEAKCVFLPRLSFQKFVGAVAQCDVFLDSIAAGQSPLTSGKSCAARLRIARFAFFVTAHPFFA